MPFSPCFRPAVFEDALALAGTTLVFHVLTASEAEAGSAPDPLAEIISIATASEMKRRGTISGAFQLIAMPTHLQPDSGLEKAEAGEPTTNGRDRAQPSACCCGRE